MRIVPSCLRAVAVAWFPALRARFRGSEPDEPERAMVPPPAVAPADTAATVHLRGRAPGVITGWTSHRLPATPTASRAPPPAVWVTGAVAPPVFATGGTGGARHG
ncbi:hypothetical protein NUM3379_20840 [Kineococcus sp. NUM-3379]